MNGRNGRPVGQLRVPRGCGGGMALTARSQLRGALGCDVLWLGRATKVAAAADGERSRRVCGCSLHFKHRSPAEERGHIVAKCRESCLFQPLRGPSPS